MSIREMITKLEQEPLVHDFLYKDGEAYLAHIFKMFDDANSDELQIGYYSPADVCIHVFVYDEKLGTVVKHEGEEPFKEPDAKVKPLDVQHVDLDFGSAREKADTRLAEFKEQPTKCFVVLQHIDQVVFNFTYLTSAMKTINIKIDATTGEVVSANAFSLLDMAKGQNILGKGS